MPLKEIHNLFHGTLARSSEEDAAALLQRLTNPAFGTPVRRLSVYRNNYTASLTNALLDTFPVAERLVSRDFLKPFAQRFSQITPSTSANLGDYGEGLPNFLEETLKESELPISLDYLPDVCRLEWLFHRASIAQVEGPPDLSILARTPDEEREHLRVRIEPSARIFCSRFPVYSIWRANREEEEPQVDLTTGGESAVVAATCHGPRVMALRSNAAHKVVTKLIDAREGLSLGVLGEIAGEELAVVLPELMGGGFLCEWM